jgi:hypothetical protein
MDKKTLEKSLAKQFPGLNEKALARHAAVVWMEAQAKAGLSREACYRQASEMEWNGRCFGQSTLERYWKWYQRPGLGRSRLGQNRSPAPGARGAFAQTLFGHRPHPLGAPESWDVGLSSTASVPQYFLERGQMA